MSSRIALGLLLVVSLCLSGTVQAVEPSTSELQERFATPPDDARPWVYWFWKNGNINRAGITADLEAMQRVGIGGVIFMEVALNTPPGPVRFFSPEWRALFAHAVAEADRLGLKITFNSGPGWTGSGGPWVTPEQSMQKFVAAPVQVTGPKKFDAVLPQPETVCGFYRDIAVLAYPAPEETAMIPNLSEKALYRRNPYLSQPGVPATLPVKGDYPAVSEKQRIARPSIVDLSSKLDATGRLMWEVPEGKWSIVRYGHTCTGQTNRPAPLVGLECDKLDQAALDSHFRQFIEELLKDAGEHGKRALAATHLDSWEVGPQSWSPKFRQEFQKRRGYDLLPYLPVLTGQVVESREVSERFLWDFRQTASDMLVENHAQHLRELAHQHGLGLSIEPYDATPCDDMALGAAADVPMCEFWSNTFDGRYTVREATSIAHVYGRPVVAAEAFTSSESWLFHPGGLKTLGDWAFCEGVNRFVIHRYVHQPFAQIRPGLSLGPHGVHYERTQTWWEWTRPWHQYLARCQYLLRQGRWVADVLYLHPEGAPNALQSPRPPLEDYKLDTCTPEALRTRVRVEEGRLVLPEGLSYRMLVLPEQETMTPQLLRCVAQLVEAGATVVGSPPRKSPSLSGYPQCDQEVAQLAERLWGARPATPGRIERAVGKGRVIWQAEAEPSAATRAPAPIAAQCRWIWGGSGEPAVAAPPGKRYFRRSFVLPEKTVESAEILLSVDNFFVCWVNGHKIGSGGDFSRLTAIDVTGLVKPGTNFLTILGENLGDGPNPAGLLGALVVRYTDGEKVVIGTDAQWQTTTKMTSDWATNPQAEGDWVAAVDLGPAGMAPWGALAEPEYRRPYPPTEMVRDVLGRMTQPDFVGPKALGYAHRQIGELDAYYVSNQSDAAVESPCSFRVTGKALELWHPETGRVRLLTQFAAEAARTTVPLRLEPGESFFVVFRPGTRSDAGGENFPHLKSLQTVAGPWTVSFSAADGGPEQPVVFDQLVDWTQRPEEGIKYYSGTARYQQTFTLEPSLAPSQAGEKRPHSYLDLGRVAVMARVRLNGRDLGIAWKSPFRLEATAALKPGQNQLEVEVVNLWPNRLIGDERLPLDCELNSKGQLAAWPQWLLDGKPSPTGRHTFASWRGWAKDAPLLESGLLGPVTILEETAE